MTTSKYLKFTSRILFFLLLACADTSTSHAEKKEISSPTKIEQQYARFLAGPTQENGREFTSTFSSLPQGEAVQAISTLYNQRKGFKELESLIQTKNAAALDALFKIKLHADGEVAEAASMALGNAIKVMPKEFLAGVKDNNLGSDRLGSLVGMFEPERLEDTNYQLKEVALRKKAIQQVNEPSLKQPKESVIKALNEVESDLKLYQ